ncbi:hypothetical protein MTR_1g105560 [Medicago truncatula]|uniref:Uncharacterized protein n=1 Tax=Medicago truncatula TaxID=3880 RepID=A0A072VQ76_MEDTR|nr:hypothetical protein MTR_1g105560 [Medicago truncatula]
MTIFKSPEYSCFRICNVDDVKVIDWICTCSKLIFQPKSIKHSTETGNKKHTAQGRKIKTKSRAETTKSQKQTKKQLRGVIFRSKLALNHPSDKKKKKKKVRQIGFEKEKREKEIDHYSD